MALVKERPLTAPCSHHCPSSTNLIAIRWYQRHAMDTLINFLGYFLSPTRKIIDLWKRGDRAHRGDALRRWSLWLFWLEFTAAIVVALSYMGPPSTDFTYAGLVPLVWAWSRINEIVYAFYSDTLSPTKESDLTAIDRIRMSMRSYFGLAFNFALLYYFWPMADLFTKPIEGGFFESLYFSGVTLATLGYGDILPKHWFCRLLALSEVFAGILLIAIAIATYIGAVNEKRPTE